jgi:thioredoxin reductase
LIRNAIAQGCEAIESVREMQEVGRSDCLDVVIVGAGPAGFAATLGAKKHGLRYQTLEQESLGGTVAHYPRGKIVMTSPATLPLVGKVKIRETTKEALLDFWLDIEKKTGVRINYHESVESITHVGSEFDVKTQKETYRTRAVVLAIGRRGTPRKLEVPGEESNKVVYRLVDPEQYRGQHVLVVGGGDSALEAATSLTDAGAASVTLAYRGEAFSRAKVKNRERVDRSAKDGLLRLAMQSEVKEIRPDEVVLKTPSDDLSLANDAVIVCAGGILPTGFLKACGIEMRTVHGAPI